MKRFAKPILWLAVGFALLAIVIWKSDPVATWRHVVGALAHPWLLAGAVLLMAVTIGGFLAKWHLMSRLAGARVDWRQSLRLFGTLFLIGTFTPARAGELAVPLLMRGGGRLTGVALVNRIIEAAITVCMGTVALLLVFTSGHPARDYSVLGGLLAVFLFAMLVLSRRRWTERVVEALGTCLRPLARWKPAARLLEKEDRIRAALGPFYEANEKVLRWYNVALLAAIITGIWLVMVWANYLLWQATISSEGGPDITMPHLIALMAVIAVSIFASPTPGGLGVSEGASILFLRQLGYTQNLMPLLLLSRLGLYMAAVLLFAASRWFGEPLPAAEADS